MRFEFDFQMDEKTLSDFYMSYNMMGGVGIFWPLIGAASIVFAFVSGETTPMLYRILYAVLGLVFLFYMPLDLKRKAKKQIQKNPYYAEAIHYVLDEEGVTTAQGEKEASLPWEQFGKVKLTKKSVILYMRNRSACVFSREVFGDDLEKAYDWMKEKIGQKK